MVGHQGGRECLSGCYLMCALVSHLTKPFGAAYSPFLPLIETTKGC